jgi:hypothetical protein
VISKLVDEELLLAHGLALDLARADQPARQALLAAVLSAERAAALGESPSEATIERYYQSMRDDLRKPGPMRARVLVVRIESRADETAARERAEAAVTRLRAGEPFEAVRSELGDRDEGVLPDERLSFETLGERLGPLAARAIGALQEGGVTDVLGSGSLLYVAQLVERDPDVTPALADAREEVLARYRAHVVDAALEKRLEALRALAEIDHLEPPP